MPSSRALAAALLLVSHIICPKIDHTAEYTQHLYLSKMRGVGSLTATLLSPRLLSSAPDCLEQQEEAGQQQSYNVPIGKPGCDEHYDRDVRC